MREYCKLRGGTVVERIVLLHIYDVHTYYRREHLVDDCKTARRTGGMYIVVAARRECMKIGDRLKCAMGRSTTTTSTTAMVHNQMPAGRYARYACARVMSIRTAKSAPGDNRKLLYTIGLPIRI